MSTPEQKLDLMERETWLNLNNLGLIAKALGYAADENFGSAFVAYNRLVRDATAFSCLLIIGGRHFAEWRPPLTRISSGSPTSSQQVFHPMEEQPAA